MGFVPVRCPVRSDRRITTTRKDKIMPRTRKVTVNTRPVASAHQAANERIIEFTAPNGNGGLINFTYDEETGRVTVDLYGLDKDVEVRVSESRRS